MSKIKANMNYRFDMEEVSGYTQVGAVVGIYFKGQEKPTTLTFEDENDNDLKELLKKMDREWGLE